MYLKLKDGELKDILNKATEKAGNIRNLSKIVKISKSTLSLYNLEKRDIKEENLTKILNFINTRLEEINIINRKPSNWKQIKGGENCVQIKKKKGILNIQLENARKNISPGKSAKAWHAKMKRKNPDLYHIIQYERFKKIGGYKYITEKGEKVRNSLEKKTADFLLKNNLQYNYEPLIKIGKSYFFPDFLIENKIILECIMWRGYDKAEKLNKKIKILEKEFKVFVLIPEKISKFYNTINKNLIFDLNEITNMGMFK